MRLTLRTMLAYMDNVLNPNEAEDLGRKIHESDFAGGLLQRIRTVSKKVRMNAPKLDGKGMGNDANTVAEYLDSALPQDRVGDFERICLESDSHLAEVAGCHQILTLVLGKPADVPESLRERVYGLGHAEKAAAAKTAAHPHAATGANGHAQAARPALEVPDYLRDGRGLGLWQFVGMVAAAFLVAALLLRMMGPFNGTHPIARLLGGQAPVVDANTHAAVLLPGTASSDTKTTPSTASGDDNPSPPNTAAAIAMATTATGDTAPAIDPPPAVEPIPDVPAADTASVTLVPEVPAAAPGVEPMPKALPSAMPPVVEVAAVPVMDVGRFVSDEQLLAIRAQDEGIWLRVPARAVLSAGDRLIALPAFRPQIALASGVQVTFAGESSVELQAPLAEGSSRIAVEYGRLLVVTAGAAGAQIDLDLAGIRGTATLVDADSALAISVKQFQPPGSDPEALPPIPIVELFNTHGRIVWHEAGQDRVDVPANQVRIYAGADPADTYGPFAPPDWIDSRSIAAIDRESATVLERLLESDKPLNLSLAETMAHRQVNVRALAARCLAHLDEFEPLVKELADPRQYSFWSGEFQTLRQAIQRGPDTATKIKTTLERLRPDEAAELYHLLWSYTPEQLAEAAATVLVRNLESEHMDVRVLAFQNLVAITGAMEFYMPQKKPEDLRAAIQNWKSRLAKNTISYKIPPSALEPYKPLDKPPAGAADLPAVKGAVAPIEP